MGNRMKGLRMPAWLACWALLCLWPALAWSAPGWNPAPAMGSPRNEHTATLLTDGTVLVAAGHGGSGVVSSAERFDPTTNNWTAVGALTTARNFHTATLLRDGSVLVVGGRSGGQGTTSAERYDPATNAWTSAGALTTGRYRHTATLLPDGTVLIAGGAGSGDISAAERYHPTTNTWTAAGSMSTERYGHTATLLPDGTVLIAGGGLGGSGTTTTERYNPSTNTWTAAAPMAVIRTSHTATLLADGTVLVVAGRWNGGRHASAERYSPTTNTWSAAGALTTAQQLHTATLLPDGSVLITGGNGDSGGALSTAERYAPTTNTWSAAGVLATARFSHAATLLADGTLLVTGGSGSGGVRSSAERYDPSTPVWTSASALSGDRQGHTATLLPDGSVLVAGGRGAAGNVAIAERYNPATDTWTAAGAMVTARYSHTATLLPDGTVLVAGGQVIAAAAIASVERFDPATNTWTAVAAMNTARRNLEATLLADGTVLVAGGLTGVGTPTPSVERFDPATNTWTAVGAMASARLNFTTTLLADGTVLASGGIGPMGYAQPERFDPATNAWSAAGVTTEQRHYNSATLLADGTVLLAGGSDPTDATSSTERYDPATNSWTAAAPLATARHHHTATLLADGTVLVVGGRVDSSPVFSSAERYDPATDTWTSAGSMAVVRVDHTATLLADGTVLVAGGSDFVTPYSSAERYTQDLSFDPSRRPVIQTPPANALQWPALTLAGSRFTGDSEASGGSVNNSASNVPVLQLRRLDNQQLRWLNAAAFTATDYQSRPLPTLHAGWYAATIFVNGIPSASQLLSSALQLPVATITVAPSSVLEDPITELVYTISLDQLAPSATSVAFTVGGSATMGSDYPNLVSPLIIPAGSTTGTITVDPSLDAAVEPDETVILTLDAGSGYSVGSPSSATGTITNDDSLPTLAIQASIAFPEGTTVGQSVNFGVFLSAPAGPGGVSFDIATADGTAIAGSDYVARSLINQTIAPGENQYHFVVDSVPDSIHEPNETFFINVSNVTGAVVTNAQGQAEILNDDPIPQLSIADVALTEGNAGSSNAVFTVSLSAASSQTVTVNHATANGTATSPSDYTAVSGALSFDPGTTTRTISVPIVGDTAVEPDETFTVTLSGVANATLADGSATGTIQNDDVPGVVVTQSGGTTTATEGGATDTYTVVLTSQPSADVSIALVGTQVTPSPTPLTFTTGNWNVAQTITVAAVDDAIVEGNHSGSITSSATSADANYNGISVAAVSVAITDNDTAGVSIVQSDGTTTAVEGGATDTYTVVLTSQPSSDVSIALSATQVTATPTPLTFTSVDWNIAQTVTVTAIDDVIVEGNHSGSATSTVTSADTNYNGVSVAAVSVAITDNDTASVSVVQSGGTTAATEGGATDTYTVVLTSQPSANVSIALTGTQVTATPTPLTFTSVDWNIAQTVTVTAIDDAIVEGNHSGSIASAVTSADSNYNGASIAAVDVAITDNDTAGVSIVQSGGDTAVAEGGVTDTYTVVLTSQPTADVSVALAGTQVTATPTPLNFTAVNWNVAQAVTVTAIDDATVEGNHSGSVTSMVTSVDTNYSGVTIAPVSVAITDNDSAGVSITSGAVSVTEGGATATYIVVLTSQPSANVIIAVNGDAQATPAPASLLFTSANWSTAQTVTVTAVDDADAEGPHSGTLSHTATSSDADYNGLAIASVIANIADNDSASVNVAPGTVSVTEGGATATYTIALTSQPTADVTIAISGDAQATSAPTSLLFTSANWSTAQTVTVTAVDDSDAEGPHNGTLSHTATSSDADYNGLTIASVTANIADNDSASVSVAPGTVSVAESGATATYTIALTSQPTADVTIAISGDAQATPAPTSLLFTAANWSTAQTVTVTAIDDGNAEGLHSGTLSHTATSSDADYNGLAVASVTASIADNDSASVSIAPGTVSVTERGATATYIVVLTSQPTANVTVTVSGDSQVTPTPTSLIFTPANWNTTQTVTVTAVDDSDAEGPHTGMLSHTATSSDADYDGLTIASVTANIADNDGAGFAIDPSSGLATTEDGETATFTIVLTSQPTADVSIGLSSSDPTEATVAPASLTFSNANWNLPQTVTVTGADDDLVDGDVTYTIVTAPATSADASYSGLDPVDVSATNADNDTATPLVVAQKALLQAGTTQLPALYRITLTNTGDGDQPDDPASDELIDVLPSTLALQSATSDVGTIALDLAGNTVRWNGAIPATTGQVVIQISADVATRETTVISNQATIRYDGDGDGSNDTTALSTDPAVPGLAQPTSFTFAGGGTTLPPPIAIPVDSRLALILLAMALLASARCMPWRRER